MEIIDEEKLNAFLNKLKQDPQYELKQELGRMLLLQKEYFTEDQIKRYDYLMSVIKY